MTSLAQGAEVSQVALSCDGLTLASGDTGGGVTLWDTASGSSSFYKWVFGMLNTSIVLMAYMSCIAFIVPVFVAHYNL